MGKIKGVDTNPEKDFRRMLWKLGYRYRKNYKKLPGKPDLVFINKRVVVFIDGEFWHGFEWEKKKLKINSNRDYWINKIEGNIERDQKNVRLLENKGWRVIRFWGKDITKNPQECIAIVNEALVGNS
jgi:DNA mismatch endonuclease Vsr